MNREILFLKDSEINNWLISEFSKKKYPVFFLGIESSSQLLSKSRLVRIISLHIRYIILALRSLIKSKKDDIIICYLDVVGLYVFLLSKLLSKRRDIVVINIMFNDRSDFLTTIKRFLYKMMLKHKHVFPTVTSSELSEIYKELFQLPEKEFFLLHDCYGKLEKYRRPYEEGEKYVFCGGTNGRDWKTIRKVAGLLPKTKFVIVGPKKNTLGENIPPNIDYHYNITFAEFQKYLANCSLLALPLNTEAPSGLIVLFSAGLMSKPVITTDNVTMREYITSGENGKLVKIGDSKISQSRLTF